MSYLGNFYHEGKNLELFIMLNTLKYVLCTNPHGNQKENIYEHWLTNDDFSGMTGCRKRRDQQRQPFCPPCFDTHEKHRTFPPRHLVRHVFQRKWSREKRFLEHLHGVAAHGGGAAESPSLLVGHHEQRGQALLHQPGKALVVQPQQGNVHPLDDCGKGGETRISPSCTDR